MSLRLKGEKMPAPVDSDEKFAQVILKACEYNPKNRYATPDEMAKALRELLDQPGHFPWATLLAVLILLAAGAAILMNWPAKNFEIYGGVRYTLPAGYQRDTENSNGNNRIWLKGNLKIWFMADGQEYKPKPKYEIMIGGYSATYDPENVQGKDAERYVYATYANPMPGENHAIYILLMGPLEEIQSAPVNDAFVKMLKTAERDAGTSVLQTNEFRQ